MANLGADPRLLLSPECNGGSPAAVASSPAAFASRPAEPASGEKLAPLAPLQPAGVLAHCPTGLRTASDAPEKTLGVC